MTVRKLVRLVAEASGTDGFAQRSQVKEAYGAGFEGAVQHAEADRVVSVDPAGKGIALTVLGKSMLRDEMTRAAV